MGVLGSSLDWTAIIVAAIAAIPATFGAFWSRQVHRQVKTPSNDPIGVVAEKSHHLNIVQTEMLKEVINKEKEETV